MSFKELFLLFLLLIWTNHGFSTISALSKVQKFESDPNSEALYLPKVESIELVSFGYRHVLSHILWFNTINYFGKHFTSDKDYRFLSHMCNLVHDLNPHSLDIVNFCSTILSWEVNAPSESIKLLTKAIEENPNDWKLLYLRGFNYMYFLQEPLKAAEDFMASSKLPGADPVTTRLAAKKLALTDNPNDALQFLEQNLSMTSDPNVRKMIEGRIRDVVYERDFRLLEQVRQKYIETYQKAPSSLNDLIAEKLIPEGPLKDPFGGTYFLDPIDGQIKSSSGKKRLSQMKTNTIKKLSPSNPEAP